MLLQNCFILFFGFAMAVPYRAGRRDLVPGLFGDGSGLETPLAGQMENPLPQASDTIIRIHPTEKQPGSAHGLATKGSATHTSLASSPLSPSLTIFQPTLTSISPAQTTATDDEISAATGASAEKGNTALDTRPEEMTAWKVIGIGIMSVTFIGTVILLIVFFDSWWGFLRDLVLKKKQDDNSETMVEDREKRGWKFKLANEDGHRYPTMASLESIIEPAQQQQAHTNHGLSPLPDSILEPHPLEPLFRRPSNRPYPGR